MYIGPSNASSYTMLDLNDHKHKQLEFNEKEQDFGVIFDNIFQYSSHIINQVNKADRLMGLIRRSYFFWCYTFGALCIYVVPTSKKKDKELTETASK